MQLSALFRHIIPSLFHTLAKDVPKPSELNTLPTEEAQSSVGKRYITMRDKTCWEASGVEREKFKILSKEIQAHQRLWGIPSGGASILTWGLYMIGITPEEAVPTLLFCCDSEAPRRELRRSIESSGILKKDEYRHIRTGECSKPPEFCVVKDKVRLMSSQEEDERWNATIAQDEVINIRSEWSKYPGRMKVTFKRASTEPICQYSTMGMTFHHQGKTFAVTAGHTLSHYLLSGPAEEDASDFEFDLGVNLDTHNSDYGSHQSPLVDRQNFLTPSENWPEDYSPNPNWRPRGKIFIRDHSLDFAMVEEHDGAVVTPDTSGLYSLRELMKKASREPEDVQVIANTGSLGRIEGRLSGTPSFVRLPHAVKFEEVWTVQFNSRLAPGDSGSLVSHPSSGQIFGHIVAGAPESGVAYIMPAFKVLERIRLCLEPLGTVLPTHSEDVAEKERERQYPTQDSTQSVYHDPFALYDRNHIPSPSRSTRRSVFENHLQVPRYLARMTSVSSPSKHDREVLELVDPVQTNWLVVAVAGAGFFVDSYNLFAINAVHPIMAIAYRVQDIRRFGVLLNFAVLLTVPLGALISGVGADLYGRRKMYGLELTLLIIGICGLALTATETVAPNTVSGVHLLIFWRMVMGIGIGADYPLSAVITAEFTPKRYRAKTLATVFLAQGLGKLAAMGFTIAVISGFLATPMAVSADEKHIQEALDKAWRLVVFSGLLPAIVVLWLKLTVISETPRYSLEVLAAVPHREDVNATTFRNPPTSPLTKLRGFLREFIGFTSHPAAWTLLLGVSATWFVQDFAFYGLGLNASAFARHVLLSTNPTPNYSVYQYLRESSDQLLLEVNLGAILGSAMAILLLQRTGVRRIQVVGFAALTAIFLLAATSYLARDIATDRDRSALNIIHFAAQLAFNLGPNTMTFVIPAELFPTRYRATSYGIAAASGKVGAVLAQFLFLKVSATHAVPFVGTSTIFLSFAVLCLLGAVVTWIWVPHTSGMSDARSKRVQEQTHVSNVRKELESLGNTGVD